jgi:hypothetical protein
VPVPVASKAELDLLLSVEPSLWATNYSGRWLSNTSLLVTVVDVPLGRHLDPAAWVETAIGSMRISVLPSAGLVLQSGVSEPCNSTIVVTDGSWGDIVCDGELFVYSATSVVVALHPPVTAGYVPAEYYLSVSRFPSFPLLATWALTMNASQSIQLPPTFPGASRSDTLRFLIRLTPDLPVYVQVAVSPPVLPSIVAKDCPGAVQPLAWPIGGPGGCQCCGNNQTEFVGEAVGLAPSGPVICTFW